MGKAALCINRGNTWNMSCLKKMFSQTVTLFFLSCKILLFLKKNKTFFQVSWKSPFILNGEIVSYEIRMPDPRITLTNNFSSSMSHVVTNLIPFTNYSVTIVACSGGGGYLGGCTESLPSDITTHATLPQGISPLSVTPISDSFIAVSWQPPSRPNGPHIR